MARIAWLLGGSLFSVAAIGFGTMSAVDLLSHERSHMHVEFTQPVTALDVDSGGGTVRIEGTDGATVTVDAALSEGLRDGSHSEQVVGDHLVVRASCPGFLSTWCGADYTIKVPRATPIVVHTTDGSITATGLQSPTVTARPATAACASPSTPRRTRSTRRRATAASPSSCPTRPTPTSSPPTPTTVRGPSGCAPIPRVTA